MRVTHVAIRPSEASDAAGRPALTPELLAATGARYSRNNDGLEAILAKVDPQNLDRSVDSIFRMVDYGHASIADMAPVALFVDGISLWLAYYVWSLVPTASGQESSTRYIRLDEDGVVAPDVLGIPDVDLRTWRNGIQGAFAAYHNSVQYWEGVFAADPQAARIPSSLLSDASDRSRRIVARMRRNYAFDRARYYLPAAAATNVMLVMSARGWVGLVQHLLSCPLPEAQRLGELCRGELAYSAPRLLKHAVRQPSLEAGLRAELADAVRQAASLGDVRSECEPTPFLDVMIPGESVAAGKGEAASDFAADLAFHDNRYGYVGASLRRSAVRFGWAGVAFAEIRDLNRHRTGSKFCPPTPVGFYGALDQVPAPESGSPIASLAAIGGRANSVAIGILERGEPTYVYHLLLGTQFAFEHTTTADKFLYEAELRTGTGAHYRYAKHLKDALELWYQRFPETRGLVLEGSAEPE